MIIITSKQPGFRRCGVAHPAEPTEYEDGFFTDEQIDALHDEPMLIVNQGIELAPGKEGYICPTSAVDKISFVSKIEILEELEKVAEGETRKTVLDAIEARRKELES